MTIDPRVALDTLTNALQEHLNAAANRRGDQDQSIENAYIAIADAFDAYEEALYEAYDEVTPLIVFAEEEDGGGEDGDDEEDFDEDLEDEDDLDFGEDSEDRPEEDPNS